MQWRVIITDSESATGVAPVCERQEDPEGPHRICELMFEGFAVHHVFDCCPHPHIETHNEIMALIVAAQLTGVDAQPCA